MATKRYATSRVILPMAAPISGIISNIPPTLLPNTALIDGCNMVYRDNRIDKRKGYLQLGTGLPLNGSVMAIKRYVQFDGDEFEIIITSRDVYKYASGAYSFLTQQYNTGTVTVTQGSEIVTGSGTSWVDNVKVGDKFRIGTLNQASAVWYEVLTVDSDTQITLTTDYLEANGTAQTYCIRKLYTVPDSSIVSLDTMIDYLIFTNGTDNIQKWDGSTTTVADLGGSPVLARYIKSFKNYLVLAHTTEATVPCPQRIRWSDTGDPETWDSGNAGYNNLAEGSDWITGLEILMDDYLAVYKEKSIYILTNVVTEEVFNVQLKIQGTGCPAPQTIKSVFITGLGDVHAFLGDDNVYAFGGVDLAPIGDSVQRELIANLSPQQIARSFSEYIKEDNEYWLYYPSAAPDVTYVDSAWVFNTKTKAWLKASCSDPLTAIGDYTTQSAVTWDDAVGTWNEQTSIWNDRTLSALSPLKLVGDKDGYVYQCNKVSNQDDGVAIDGYFVTKDFVFGPDDKPYFDISKDVMQLDVYAKGNTLTIDYSIDAGFTWTNATTLTLSSSDYTRNKVDLRVNCEKIRFRFRNNVINETFSVRNLTLYYIPRGRIDA